MSSREASTVETLLRQDLSDRINSDQEEILLSKELSNAGQQSATVYLTTNNITYTVYVSTEKHDEVLSYILFMDSSQAERIYNFFVQNSIGVKNIIEVLFIHRNKENLTRVFDNTFFDLYDYNYRLIDNSDIAFLTTVLTVGKKYENDFLSALLDHHVPLELDNDSNHKMTNTIDYFYQVVENIGFDLAVMFFKKTLDLKSQKNVAILSGYFVNGVNDSILLHDFNSKISMESYVQILFLLVKKNMYDKTLINNITILLNYMYKNLVDKDIMTLNRFYYLFSNDDYSVLFKEFSISDSDSYYLQHNNYYINDYTKILLSLYYVRYSSFEKIHEAINILDGDDGNGLNDGRHSILMLSVAIACEEDFYITPMVTYNFFGLE